MVLRVIYVVRHGFRLNWVVDPQTGTYRSAMPTPTGIPSDPILASYGQQQAKQLAERVKVLEPPVDVVYSSPFYRCLQTLEPVVAVLKEQGRDIRVHVENGVGEFYGRARFDHPSPASLQELQEHFDFLRADHEPAIVPSKQGETPLAIHNRHAYALHRIIEYLDSTAAVVNGKMPEALLICTHAASMICIGRALTGLMPEDFNVEDFRCGTCALSKFVRRSDGSDSKPDVETWDPASPEEIPDVDWKRGRGVSGGWNCELNGDCSFLSGGEERSWNFAMEIGRLAAKAENENTRDAILTSLKHFQGDESFILFDETQAKALVAPKGSDREWDTKAGSKIKL